VVEDGPLRASRQQPEWRRRVKVGLAAQANPLRHRDSVRRRCASPKVTATLGAAAFRGIRNGGDEFLVLISRRQHATRQRGSRPPAPPSNALSSRARHRSDLRSCDPTICSRIWSLAPTPHSTESAVAHGAIQPSKHRRRQSRLAHVHVSRCEVPQQFHSAVVTARVSTGAYRVGLRGAAKVRLPVPASLFLTVS
jgi:hypothetical protein